MYRALECLRDFGFTNYEVLTDFFVRAGGPNGAEPEDPVEWFSEF